MTTAETTIADRLENLLGPYWQAALDHAGVMSRRRAREIGAGDEPSGALVAAVELLERSPRAKWPTRWKVAEYRMDAISAVELGFERFESDDLITDPADELPELLDSIKTGKTAADAVDGEIEWWGEWGQRKHEALVAFNAGAPERLREEISQRLVAEGDYEASVMILESAVEALDAAERAKSAESLDALLQALLAFDEACLSGVEPDDYGLDLMDLPTFGGDEPADTQDIYSWDETRVLSCADGCWAIGEREDGDEA